MTEWKKNLFVYVDRRIFITVDVDDLLLFDTIMN